MRSYPRLAADAGRIVANPDVAAGELKMALFEVPEEFSGEPGVVLAASTSSPGWRRQHVEIHHAGRVHMVQTPRRKSVLGCATAALGAAQPDALAEVLLYDTEQWLVSCADDDLELGDNLAVLGKEVIQFGEATSLGGGRFRLGRLRRGQAGTKGAAHAKGEPFALIERGGLQLITLPAWSPGSPVRAAAQNGSAECSLTLAPTL
jgi:hypothetical protein